MFNAKSGVVVGGEFVQESFGFSSFFVSACSMEHLHERSIGEKMHKDAAVALVGQPVEVEPDARAQLEGGRAELLECEVQAARECNVGGTADG